MTTAAARPGCLALTRTAATEPRRRMFLGHLSLAAELVDDLRTLQDDDGTLPDAPRAWRLLASLERTLLDAARHAPDDKTRRNLHMRADGLVNAEAATEAAADFARLGPSDISWFVGRRVAIPRKTNALFFAASLAELDSDLTRWANATAWTYFRHGQGLLGEPAAGDVYPTSLEAVWLFHATGEATRPVLPFALFYPEAEGLPGRVTRTVVHVNLHEARFWSQSITLARRALDGRIIEHVWRADVRRLLLAWFVGHEVGHTLGPRPYVAGGAADDFHAAVIEEARADLLGLSLTTGLLKSILPDSAPPEVYAVFLTELLRYGSRPIADVADAGAAALELDLLADLGGCHIGPGGRLMAEPDGFERAVEAALARVLATSSDGSAAAIDALLADYGMVRADGSIGCGPVAERILAPFDHRAEKVVFD